MIVPVPRPLEHLFVDIPATGFILRNKSLETQYQEYKANGYCYPQGFLAAHRTGTLDDELQ